MKKSLFTLIVSAGFLASCTMSYPGIATGNEIVKSGTASRKIFMGIAIKPVDLSIEKAAKSGGITKVATVDYSVKKGLFFTTYKVEVTGN